jgi:hypothetical protein
MAGVARTGQGGVGGGTVGGGERGEAGGAKKGGAAAAGGEDGRRRTMLGTSGRGESAATSTSTSRLVLCRAD